MSGKSSGPVESSGKSPDRLAGELAGGRSLDLQTLSVLELRQVCYFMAVVEAGSFTGAAKRLGMTQPPLSQRILALEALLSGKSADLPESFAVKESFVVKLFDRSKKPIVLTPAGEVFRQEAEAALIHLERAILRARQASQGYIGRLVIGVTNVIANSLLPEIVQCFRQRFPDVILDFREVPISQQIQMLRQCEVDLIFPKYDDSDSEDIKLNQARFLAKDPEKEPELIFKLILEEYFILAISEQHPLASLSTIPLTALEDAVILVPPLELFPFYEKVITLCQAAGFEPKLASNASVTGVVTLLSLVAAGVGVSILPNHVQSLQRTGVVYRPIQCFGLTRTLAAVWRWGDRSVVLRQFLRVVEEVTHMSLLDSW